MWLAILITIVAASANNIGKALQKQATKGLPRLSLKRQDVLRQYLSSSEWLAGVGADFGGGLLMVAAFALAPVSVVQPVSAVGLVVLMVFSHFYLKERMQAVEWAAAAAAGVGILMLGVSSSSSSDSSSGDVAAALAPPQQQQPQQAQPLHGSLSGTEAQQLPQQAEQQQQHHQPPTQQLTQPAESAAPARVLISFLVMLLLLALECWWRQRRRAHASGGGARGAHPPKTATAAAAAAQADALACGLEAGACFGFSAAASRTGFQLAPALGWPLVPVGLMGSVALTSCGFVLQTRGFKSGSAVVVCTMASVSSMLAGVLAGLLALGEKLPGSRQMRTLRLVSWALILLGVASLAAGPAGVQGSARGALRRALLLLPAAARRRLPSAVQLMAVQRSSSQGGLLLAGDGSDPPDKGLGDAPHLLPVTQSLRQQ